MATIKDFYYQLKEGIEEKLLQYTAGHVTEHNGDYLITFQQAGAEMTFSVGQGVFDKDGNLMGYLGIGLFDRLDDANGYGLRIPTMYWKICLPTEHCAKGKAVFTYWQNKAKEKNDGK